MSGDPPPTPNPDDPLYHEMIYDPADYYGYDLPEYQGEAEIGDIYVGDPRDEDNDPVGTQPLGEAELQYLPFQRRPTDLGVSDFYGDFDNPDRRPDIEDMYFWVAGMSDELTATHALVWRRVSSLLEQASATLRARTDGVRATWEGDAADNFFAWVGSTLFSIDEWKGVTANNAYALEVIGPAIRDAQEQMRQLYVHYRTMMSYWESWKTGGEYWELEAADYRAHGYGSAQAAGISGNDPVMPVLLPDNEGWDPTWDHLPQFDTEDGVRTGVDQPEGYYRAYVRNDRDVVLIYQMRAAEIVEPLAQTYVDQHYSTLGQGRKFAGPLEIGMPAPVFGPGALNIPAAPAMPELPAVSVPDIPIVPAPVVSMPTVPLGQAPTLPPHLQELLDGGQLAGGPLPVAPPVLPPGTPPAAPPAFGVPPVPPIPPGFAPPGTARNGAAVPAGFAPGSARAAASAAALQAQQAAQQAARQAALQQAALQALGGAGTQPTALTGALPATPDATTTAPGQVPAAVTAPGRTALPGVTANQLATGAMMPPPPPPMVPPVQATQRAGAANQPGATGSQARGLGAGMVPPTPFIPPGRATQQGRTPTAPQRVPSTLPGTAARPPVRAAGLAGLRGTPGHPAPVAPIAGAPGRTSQPSGQRPEPGQERVSVPGEHDGELWTVKRPKGLIQSAAPHRPVEHGKSIGSPA